MNLHKKWATEMLLYVALMLVVGYIWFCVQKYVSFFVLLRAQI